MRLTLNLIYQYTYFQVVLKIGLEADRELPPSVYLMGGRREIKSVNRNTESRTITDILLAT